MGGVKAEECQCGDRAAPGGWGVRVGVAWQKKSVALWFIGYVGAVREWLGCVCDCCNDLHGVLSYYMHVFHNFGGAFCFLYIAFLSLNFVPIQVI